MIIEAETLWGRTRILIIFICFGVAISFFWGYHFLVNESQFSKWLRSRNWAQDDDFVFGEAALTLLFGGTDGAICCWQSIYFPLEISC
jgi:hypothetical protein